MGGKIIGMHREVQSCTADYFLKKLTRLQDCNNIRRLECTTKTTLSKKKKDSGRKMGENVREILCSYVHGIGNDR